MVISGNIRGNGKQLAQYLISKGENKRLWIFEVDGMMDADEDYLRQTILSMELMAEMTKSDKAFFHAQINPANGEDKRMTPEQWSQAADILAHQLGYHNQRRVIVMHQKKDRTHAHVVFERYKYQTGKLVDNKHSRLKMDSSRKIMEEVFGHKRTPYRNKNKNDLKEVATRLWNSTTTGAEFVHAARQEGYIVAEGMANRPFMIVDKQGRSFNLVKQIDGVRTKEVRERLRHEKLTPERQAIEIMRAQQENTGSGKQGKQQASHQPNFEKAASAFADNRKDAMEPNTEQGDKLRQEIVSNAFKENADQFDNNNQRSDAKTDDERKHEAAQAFAANKPDATKNDKASQEKKQKLIIRQKRIREQHKRTPKHRR